jgi:hypothetical protein
VTGFLNLHLLAFFQMREEAISRIFSRGKLVRSETQGLWETRPAVSRFELGSRRRQKAMEPSLGGLAFDVSFISKTIFARSSIVVAKLLYFLY